MMSLCKVGNQTSSQDPQAVNSRIFVGNLNTFQVTKTDVEKVKYNTVRYYPASYVNTPKSPGKGGGAFCVLGGFSRGGGLFGTLCSCMSCIAVKTLAL